jgi:hypothetical protein
LSFLIVLALSYFIVLDRFWPVQHDAGARPVFDSGPETFTRRASQTRILIWHQWGGCIATMRGTASRLFINFTRIQRDEVRVERRNADPHTLRPFQGNGTLAQPERVRRGLRHHVGRSDGAAAGACRYRRGGSATRCSALKTPDSSG